MSSLRLKALQLLSRREHSRAQLSERLLATGADEEEVASLLAALTSEGLLSDVRYAHARVRSRASRFGNTRLGRDLQQGGVAAETIEVALAEGGDELGRCLSVWQKKFGGHLPVSAAEKAKQLRFLQYRGFSSQVIQRVLRQDFEDVEVAA